LAVVASLHARRAGLHCVGGPASSWSMVLPGADGAQRNGPIDAASGRATGGEGFSIAFLPLQILIVLIVLHVRAGGRACTGPGNHRRVAIRFASCLPRSCTLISRGKILRTSQLGEAVWYSRRTFAMSAGCLCARNRANAHSSKHSAWRLRTQFARLPATPTSARGAGARCASYRFVAPCYVWVAWLWRQRRLQYRSSCQALLKVIRKRPAPSKHTAALLRRPPSKTAFWKRCHDARGAPTCPARRHVMPASVPRCLRMPRARAACRKAPSQLLL
jgi:hypothetical protein